MPKSYLSNLSRLWGGALKNRILPDVRPLKEFTAVQFTGPESLQECIVRSDQELNGYSTASLDWDETEKAAHFHGNLNLDLPASRPDIQRSGYAMFRTRDPPKNFLEEDIYWDWQNLAHVALRVKGDRRKYFVNIQSKTALPTEIHQHRLFLYNPGEWEVAVIPVKQFLLTHWGRVESRQELNRNKVRTIGIGLLDRQYGPFSLYVDWIKAICDDEAERYIAEGRKLANKDVLAEYEKNRIEQLNDDTMIL
ncbi:complex I intermediate-associated protein 30-domain-containing protein [Lipomyces arxii]|uniref:complex I intermediate-associated protein 30-domain-containing protein n=1 Tax=Lipomyces arxii TaxID=56418 RepID=UPI0034CD3B15